MGNFLNFGKNDKMKLRILLVFIGWMACKCEIEAQTSFHSAAKALQPDKEFENVQVQKLFGDDHASGFVIWIKSSVPLHKHAAHSETVCILSGKAEMSLGDQKMKVRTGDIIFIPQGTPHSVQVSRGVLKVLSIQAPEFDGSDRVLID